jgi:hypothetical protein
MSGLATSPQETAPHNLCFPYDAAPSSSTLNPLALFHRRHINPLALSARDAVGHDTHSQSTT